MANSITLKALGLNFQPNNLELPPGSMIEASNVIIRRNDVIESRRGFKLYGESFGSSDDTASQLFSYQQRLLRHYNHTLSFDTNTQNTDNEEIFHDFSGDVTEVSPGLRIKSVQSNGNFYFTTNNGIKKISAKSAADFTTSTGLIQQAGMPPGLDLNTTLEITTGNQVGFLPADSTVAYRVLWGEVDKNKNTILGAPSQRSVIYNPQNPLTISDFNALLFALDEVVASGSPGLIVQINGMTYVDNYGLPLNASSTLVYNTLLNFTAALDNSLVLASDTGSGVPLTLGAVVVNPGATTSTGVLVFTNPPNASDYFNVGSSFLPSSLGLTGLNSAQTVVSTGYDTGSISATTANNGNAQFTVTSTSLLSAGDYVTLSAFATNTVNNDIWQIQSIDSITQFTINGGYSGGTDTGTYLKNQLTFHTSQVSSTVDITSIGTATSNTSSSVLSLVTTTTPHGLSIGQYVTIRGSNSTPIATGIYQVESSGFTTNAFNIKLDTTVAGTALGTIEFIAITGAKVNSNVFNAIPKPLLQDTPPTAAELASLQTYIQDIETALKDEPNGVIPSGTITTFLAPLEITTTANVSLNFTIPESITTSDFYQIYRSAITTATGTDVLSDLIPNDEMLLVIEGFPTQNDIDNGYITVLDQTPDSFIQGSTPLYTNENSGEGILQANYQPPLAHDINRYKNYVFFANTQSYENLAITMLGVTQIITDYNNNLHPKLLITDGLATNEYLFVLGVRQVITLTPTAGNTYNTSGTANYFTLDDSAGRLYYVWFSVAGGTMTDPMISGRTGIMVSVTGADTVVQVDNKIADTMALYSFSFTTTFDATTVTITNVAQGVSESPISSLPGGFGVVVSTPGSGEQLTKNKQTVTTVADVAGSLASKYFYLNGPFNQDLYYFWFSVSGTGTDPMISGRTGIEVAIVTNATAAAVASAINSSINLLPVSQFYTSTVLSNVVTITNRNFGPTVPASNGGATPGFSYATLTVGALDVLLSSNVSPTLAVDETAQSLVRVINRNVSSDIYGYYLSTSTTPPGQIQLQSRDYLDPKFYVLANTSGTGSSFSPDLSPTYVTLSNTATNPTVVTVTNHGYANGDQVVITNSNSLPSISGVWTISNVTTNTFTIPVSVTTAGTTGSIINANIAEVSNNNVTPNGLYYSKLQQPDAVPLVNNIPVGIENKDILRIFPLRDSLFIFKEEGIYRLSGDVAPFTVSLFDNSTFLIAPDSVDVSNNVIYAWAQQGVVTVNESGASVITRPIDTETFKLASSNYPDFPTATWGVGYVSDNSYLVFTVQQTTDTKATICYRYSALTNTWTSFDKTNTCGIVNPVDDKLYLGAGDVNFLEQERKTFTRLDYADREKQLNLVLGNYLNLGQQLLFKVETVSGINIGDVLVQTQYLSTYIYNALLQKLDLDLGTNFKDYYSTLKLSGGADLRTAIVALAAKLDTDSGLSAHNYSTTIADLSFTISNVSATNPTVITYTSAGVLVNGRIVNINGSNALPTVNGIHQITAIDSTHFSVPVSVLTVGTTGTGETLINTFLDIQACYNAMIELLNADSNLVFKNYEPVIMSTVYESVITSVNTFTNILTLSPIMPFVVGPITNFEAIDCEFTYAPITMGDALSMKHLSEAEILFENRAFTNATMSFSSDLIPSFTSVDVPGAGNGIFGNNLFGNSQFGGKSNSAPFRTLIPRNAQRGRYLNVEFNHTIARENFSIYGITVTGQITPSTRTYRR